MIVKKRVKIYLILIMVLITIVCLWLVGYKERKIVNREDVESFNQVGLPTINLQEMFYIDESFAQGVLAANEINPRDDIRAIIVPHHLLAASYLAQLVKMSSGRTINNVIIIGPNHFNVGTNLIVSTKARWQTPFGFVYPDNNLVDNFATTLGVELDDQVFVNEHSIGTIAPFIKYYLPQAKVLPIIFSSYASFKEVQKVNNWLSKNLTNETLIIYSLDFSHYLTKDKADKNDLVTQALILERQVDKILTLNNDYVDSPVTLAVSLMLAESKGWQTEIIARGNSFDLSYHKPTETTSYFAIVFNK